MLIEHAPNSASSMIDMVIQLSRGPHGRYVERVVTRSRAA